MAVSYFILTNKKRELKANNTITYGNIYWCEVSADKGQASIAFLFYVGDKTIYGEKTYTGLKNADFNSFCQKGFPVIYCPTNPDNYELLISSKDFSQYGIVQPDSLIKYNSIFNL
ncbi:hypothetical protein CNR22_09075 [Sphingobacteriaceae bacterium]|nr:hypothetical protein CNR22_09075 [Sphingobacteriaceae bacterium]